MQVMLMCLAILNSMHMAFEVLMAWWVRDFLLHLHRIWHLYIDPLLRRDLFRNFFFDLSWHFDLHSNFNRDRNLLLSKNDYLSRYLDLHHLFNLHRNFNLYSDLKYHRDLNLSGNFYYLRHLEYNFFKAFLRFFHCKGL